jgi:hypothetical protein
MKTSISRLLTAALGLLLVLGANSMFAADQPYVGLAKQLIGFYDGVAGPANNLRVIIHPARPSVEEQRLNVTVQGTYNGNNVRFDGFLRLEPQGDSARLIWLMRRGNDCQVDIHPEGDGFVGVSLPAMCQTAFQNPTPGKWEFQIEPGSFRLRNVESGETLRFRKVKSPAK